MDDNDSETILVVADNKEEAEEKVQIIDWSCLLWVNVREITKIDGYIV
ncbi:MAG: hypothetical protein K0R54_679 [Clostridiaceae bacterium]|jgi:hypothetical protein|nr:hypothetical protein [Clostridiaceae bacterium]